MDESSKESSGERQSQEPEAAKLTNPATKARERNTRRRNTRWRTRQHGASQ